MAEVRGVLKRVRRTVKWQNEVLFVIENDKKLILIWIRTESNSSGRHSLHQASPTGNRALVRQVEPAMVRKAFADAVVTAFVFFRLM